MSQQEVRRPGRSHLDLRLLGHPLPGGLPPLLQGLGESGFDGYIYFQSHGSPGIYVQDFLGGRKWQQASRSGADLLWRVQVIKYDKQNPAASSVEFTVEAASIDTGNNDRDEHLRGADFFDVQKFPTLTFTSTKVAAKDADTLDVTGNLTMHGVTKQITIPIEVLGSVKTPNGEKAGFATSFTVNRKDYGIVWNRVLDAGGSVLGDDVKVHIAIEANRQAEKPVQ